MTTATAITVAADCNSRKGSVATVSSQVTAAPLPSVGVITSPPDGATTLSSGLSIRLQQVQDQRTETSGSENDSQVCSMFAALLLFSMHIIYSLIYAFIH